MLDFTKHITVAFETSKGWFAANTVYGSPAGSRVFEVREVLTETPFVVAQFVVSDDVTEDDIRVQGQAVVEGLDRGTAETDPVAKDSEEDDMQQEENRKARQAAYTAKHREKAKALRRPEARDVAAAYMAVIESDALMQHVVANDAYVAREYPNASPAVVAEVRARSIVDFVRSKVIHDLTAEKGFNFEQVKDKVHSMVANTLTA